MAARDELPSVRKVEVWVIKNLSSRMRGIREQANLLLHRPPQTRLHDLAQDLWERTFAPRLKNWQVLGAEIVDQHDVDEGLVEQTDDQGAAVRGDAQGGCAVVWLGVIHGPR
jgi:hypothetical protein